LKVNTVEVLRDLELLECTIIERTSLLTVKVDFNGVQEVVYINNTGRLKEILVRGKKCYCTKTRGGKLRYKLIGVEDEHYASLIDTHLQEEAFITAHKLGYIDWLRDYSLIKRNVKVSSETIDFLFTSMRGVTLVEIKSAVMKLPGNYAGYPDAPTPRGARQIRALAVHASKGGESIVVFIAGIPLAKGFQLYCCVDKEIEKAVKHAVRMGVLFKALNFYLDPITKSVVLGETNLPVKLECYNTCTNNA
jgi:sugar fermentation stimulation protein A